MSDPFISQIIMFGGNFAPRTYAYCDGQLLAVSSNDALFSLVGTIYGGDGRTTFGLPDLRGRVAVHSGDGSAGPGLTGRRLGAKGGAENLAMNATNLPSHTHGTTVTINASGNAATSTSPNGTYLAPETGGLSTYQGAAGTTSLGDGALNVSVNAAGGSQQGLNNMMPFVGVHYIIALYGVYPSRN